MTAYALTEHWHTVFSHLEWAELLPAPIEFLHSDIFDPSQALHALTVLHTEPIKDSKKSATLVNSPKALNPIPILHSCTEIKPFSHLIIFFWSQVSPLFFEQHQAVEVNFLHKASARFILSFVFVRVPIKDSSQSMLSYHSPKTPSEGHTCFYHLCASLNFLPLSKTQTPRTR